MTLRPIYKKCKAHLIELQEIFENENTLDIEVSNRPVEYEQGKWGYSVTVKGQKTMFTKMLFDLLVEKKVLEKI